MLKLFDPQTKIQKDRLVLRDTDMRMAKYSRRGIITNFLIYSICLLIEQNFFKTHTNLSLALTAGLLLTTILRGYFLFRMDVIYPRGPSAWRKKYFLATLLGAAWWSLILSSLTLAMDMQGEAALLWLYTVVFFATTAHAFAPYSNFCRAYQLIALIPASLCTFMIGDLVGAFYGAVLLFFSYLLAHHSQLISENYWERLEAQHSLARKTESLEEEKRDTRASVQLINQYLELLSVKMRGLLKETESKDAEHNLASSAMLAEQRSRFEVIYANVDEFQRILAKDVDIQPRTFNVRHFIQSIVRERVETAERKKVELEIALSPALPARLFGDAHRLGQIIQIMVSNSLSQFEECLMFVEVEFLREYETSGELHVSITRQRSQEKKSFFQSQNNSQMEMDLDLTLAKALAFALGGELELNEVFGSEGKILRLRMPLSLAELDTRADYHRLEYKGRPLLLVHPNAYWLDHKRLELDSMGFAVQTANSYKRARQILNDSLNSGSVIAQIMYYSCAGDDTAAQFCNELLSHSELKHIHQFVICSPIGRQFFEDRVSYRSPLIHYVDKPSSVFEFELALNTVVEPLNEDNAGEEKESSYEILWVALGKNFDNAKLYEGHSIHIQRVGDVKQISKMLESQHFNLAVVESSSKEDVEGINSIRHFEMAQSRESLIPIIGVGSIENRHIMLEHGVDHFIDIESLVNGDTRALRFWASGQHH